MQKQNNKGFVLMETLIVSVFVMALFTMLYTSVFPLVGQYERREFYDDIDSKYTAHWVRKMVLDYGMPNLQNTVQNNGYSDISDCSAQNFTDTTYCLKLKQAFHITKMYVTRYNLQNVKTSLIADNNTSVEFDNYIDYLPDFNKDSDKSNYHRVIVEIDHDGKYKSYGTIEVMR